MPALVLSPKSLHTYVFKLNFLVFLRAILAPVLRSSRSGLPVSEACVDDVDVVFKPSKAGLRTFGTLHSAAKVELLVRLYREVGGHFQMLQTTNMSRNGLERLRVAYLHWVETVAPHIQLQRKRIALKSIPQSCFHYSAGR